MCGGQRAAQAGPLNARADLRDPHTLAGRYELLGVLGRGGMGVVHSGWDRVLRRAVAVKVLADAHAFDPEAVERFEGEARAAASLSHPSIVAVYDSGRDAGRRFIVMERVRGRSLAEMLRGGAALGVLAATRIALPIADALAAAHRCGIVHSDVKPGNLMVDGAGAVKVLDFGIARAIARGGASRSDTVIGSAAYMAPEVARGEPAGTLSDVYSLGCVLYEMLTGSPPFTGAALSTVLNQQVYAMPQRPSTLRHDIAPELDALVMAMLSKSPRDRPAGAAEVRARLGDALTRARGAAARGAAARGAQARTSHRRAPARVAVQAAGAHTAVRAARRSRMAALLALTMAFALVGLVALAAASNAGTDGDGAASAAAAPAAGHAPADTGVRGGR